MPMIEEHDRMEYVELMRRGQDAERVAQFSWIAGALVAAVTMSWSISARSPGLMIPVVFAIAIGFYGMLRGRQQVRAITSYIQEFYEGARGRWFTRVHRLQHQSSYRAAGDWLSVCLANAGVIVALMLAWMYAGAAPRGDLMAGIVTACGVIFGFHSISQTLGMSQTDWPAMWRRTSDEHARVERAA